MASNTPIERLQFADRRTMVQLLAALVLGVLLTLGYGALFDAEADQSRRAGTVVLSRSCDGDWFVLDSGRGAQSPPMDAELIAVFSSEPTIWACGGLGPDRPGADDR